MRRAANRAIGFRHRVPDTSVDLPDNVWRARRLRERDRRRGARENACQGRTDE
jgi:hypothetical protein